MRRMMLTRLIKIQTADDVTVMKLAEGKCYLKNSLAYFLELFSDFAVMKFSGLHVQSSSYFERISFVS